MFSVIFDHFDWDKIKHLFCLEKKKKYVGEIYKELNKLNSVL